MEEEEEEKKTRRAPELIGEERSKRWSAGEARWRGEGREDEECQAGRHRRTQGYFYQIIPLTADSILCDPIFVFISRPCYSNHWVNQTQNQNESESDSEPDRQGV